jgi:hypothetical protein
MVEMRPVRGGSGKNLLLPNFATLFHSFNCFLTRRLLIIVSSKTILDSTGLVLARVFSRARHQFKKYFKDKVQPNYGKLQARKIN